MIFTVSEWSDERQRSVERINWILRQLDWAVFVLRAAWISASHMVAPLKSAPIRQERWWWRRGLASSFLRLDWCHSFRWQCHRRRPVQSIPVRPVALDDDYSIKPCRQNLAPESNLKRPARPANRLNRSRTERGSILLKTTVTQSRCQRRRANRKPRRADLANQEPLVPRSSSSNSSTSAPTVSKYKREANKKARPRAAFYIDIQYLKRVVERENRGRESWRTPSSIQSDATHFSFKERYLLARLLVRLKDYSVLMAGRFSLIVGTTFSFAALVDIYLFCHEPTWPRLVCTRVPPRSPPRSVMHR